MNGSDNVELRQLNNQMADIGDALSAMVSALAEQRRMMWAHMVMQSGSWQAAANSYVLGLEGAAKIRKILAQEGGDLHV